MQEAGINDFKDKVMKESESALLYFTAEWCGPCEVLTQDIKEIAEEFSFVNYFSCDIDKDKELMKHCGVKYIPCIIFYKNGKEVTRRTGVVPVSQIREVIITHLD